MHGVTEIVHGHAANAATAAVHHIRWRERAGDGVIGGIEGSDAFGREGVGEVRVRWGANWKGLLLRWWVMEVRLRERRYGSRCGGCGVGGVERHGGGGGGGGGGGFGIIEEG